MSNGLLVTFVSCHFLQNIRTAVFPINTFIRLKSSFTSNHLMSFVQGGFVLKQTFKFVSVPKQALMLGMCKTPVI